MREERTNNNSGGVIILLAVAIVAITGLAALSIDTFRIATTNTEKLLTSDYAALGSLDSYLNRVASYASGTPVATTHPLGMTDAQTRVRQIGADNLVTAQYGAQHVRATDTIYTGTGTPPATAAGKLQSGIWWQTYPSGLACSASTCPCTQSPPCFQECDPVLGCERPDSPGNYLNASAMSVELKSVDTGPSQTKTPTIFASVFGKPTFSSAAGGIGSVQQTNSIASLAPRHMVFLVDISRATMIDATTGTGVSAYPFFERNGVGPEYAYRLTGGCGSPAVNGLTVPSSYNCVIPAAGNGAVYAVAEATRPVAQPWSDILDGVNEAVTQFRDSASYLDRLSVVFFDSDILQSRVYGFDLTTRASQMFSKVAPEVTQLLNATATQSGRLNAYLFPRSDGSGPNNTNPSDLNGAFDVANEILRNDPTFALSNNIVVYFGNGVASCYTDSGGNRQCLSLNPAVQAAPSQFQAARLSLQEMLYQKALALFRPDQVRFHALLFGESVPPHTIMVKSPNGSSCMNDLAMRQRNFYDVYWNTNDPDELNRFMQLGDGVTPVTDVELSMPSYYLYSAVALLQGRWGPVRPPCGGAPSATAVDNVCAAAGTPTPATLTTPLSSLTYAQAGSGWPATAVDTATNRRLICDPLNRTRVAQARDHMDEIFKERPLLLVDN